MSEYAVEVLLDDDVTATSAEGAMTLEIEMNEVTSSANMLDEVSVELLMGGTIVEGLNSVISDTEPTNPDVMVWYKPIS